ncbi:ArsR/SmtB family transcription factor [Paenibacillus dendritiformis]|uniref:ArsR/SmtB family transcription factor n=1 Tax=Paenibacillus dendritiformis TaxID=130049 RepID=UPI000DA982E1|nr:metalloregulator ArsR/SmtB family transcription factor [Paenibacillus dendritiformis]PZM67619.1 ArsR family transcriptional regulator [Paenibacillus dendritiformis]
MTDIYRAISDPIRRQILRMTAQREYTQSEIVQAFAISQPGMKKHLAILLEENLIRERKKGKYRYYSLQSDVFRLHYEQLQRELGMILEHKLAALKHYVEGDLNDET